MNPQMQNYRQFPPTQARPPAARRPGECDPSTASFPGFQDGPPTYPYDTRMDEDSSSYQQGCNLRRAHAQSSRLPPPRIPMDPMLTHFQQSRSHGPVLLPQNPYVNRLPPAPSCYPLIPAANQFEPDVLMYLPRMPAGPVHPGAHYAQQQAAQIQQQQNQQRHAIAEHQSASRRVKKPTDRNMPDGIEDLVIGDGVQLYKDLREAEKKLDFTLARKRLELQDTFTRTSKRQRTLRMWITNTAENQPWQDDGMDEDTFDFNSGSDATYQVRIEGRLLPEPEDDEFLSDDEDEPKYKDKEIPQYVPEKMSHFFKSMHVEFDRNKTNPHDPSFQVEWKKQPNAPDVDQITFTRRGDENQNIVINLFRDEQPERYRLSHALAQTLDMEEGDRAEVVMGLWEYVKFMGLQEDEEKRSIRCDEALRQIFGRDQIYFPQIPDQIMQHLHPLPPIKIPYTIRVDSAFLASPSPMILDIVVQVDDPMRAKIAAFLQNQEHIAAYRQIAKLDDELAVVVQAIAHSKARHSFFRELSKDPVNFMKKWVASQQRDLEVILGEAARGGGEDGMGIEFSRGGSDGVWGSEVVREAARYLLARPAVGKPPQP